MRRPHRSRPPPPYVIPDATAEYPGAYRPYDPDAAAAVYAVQPPDRTSRAWIWWTLGGVVLLGILITAAVVIPLLLLSSDGGASVPSPTVSSVEDDGTPSSADEDAATAAVELYDDAWRLADCEDFFATTTEEYREYNDWVDCESFYSASRNFYGGVEDFEMEIREVETVGGAIAVSVTESYAWLYDEDGAPLEEPEPYEDRLEYLLVESGGAWVIDEALRGLSLPPTGRGDRV